MMSTDWCNQVPKYFDLRTLETTWVIRSTPSFIIKSPSSKVSFLNCVYFFIPVWCFSSFLKKFLEDNCFTTLCCLVSYPQKFWKGDSWDFPGGPVVKNPPCNAGNLGLVHGWGPKIPQASRQQSPSTTATEPTCSGARVPQPDTPGAARKGPGCCNWKPMQPNN